MQDHSRYRLFSSSKISSQGLWVAAVTLWLGLAVPPLWAADTGSARASSAAADKGRQGDHEHAGSTREDTTKDGHAEEAHGKGKTHGHGSRLPDKAIPLQLDGFPERPKPLIEWGEPFLGTGTLDPGIELPTGAVWQPSLLAFGTFRTAVQSFEPDSSGDSRVTEWASRLDVFFNLQLSGSERLVAGFRALDGNGRFTSYFFEHPDPVLEGELRDELDADVEVLFFEGELGEIFPNLDRDDFGSFDLGFSVGRQPLFFQEGLLINDTIDGLGLTRNTLLPRGTSNFRTTLFLGFDNIDRGTLGFGNVEDRSARMYALLTSADLPRSTIDFDLAYVDADELAAGGGGDLAVVGLSAVQRLGRASTSFRVVSSFAVDEETPASTDGTLLFSEIGWIPHGTHDHAYVTSFLAIDAFTAAARGPATGGPLGRAGINFAAVGLGSYGAPLDNQARDVAGGAFGYQKFFDHTRKQLLLEAAGRFGTARDVGDAYALTARYQVALKRRFVAVLDVFAGGRDDPGLGSRTLYGGRLEWVVKF